MSVALEQNTAVAAARPDAVRHGLEACDRSFSLGAEPEDLHRLESIATVIDLASRHTVFFEGDPADFAFSVVRGTVKASKALADGRRQITGFLNPGDFMGIPLRHAHGYHAETLTSAVIMG